MPDTAAPPEGGPLPSRALAQLARDVGTALVRFAAALEAGLPVDDVRAGLGPRQRQILDLPGLAGPEGLSTRQVADAIDYRVPGTTAALHRLAELGLLEQVPDIRPAHWRRTG